MAEQFLLFKEVCQVLYLRMVKGIGQLLRRIYITGVEGSLFLVLGMENVNGYKQIVSLVVKLLHRRWIQQKMDKHFLSELVMQLL